MNYRKFSTLPFFAAGLLLFSHPTANAQQASANIAAVSTDAADRQFLAHLEQVDGTKPRATAAPAAPAPTAPAPTETRTARKAPQSKATASVVKSHENLPRTHREHPEKRVEVAEDGSAPPVVVTSTTVTEYPVTDEERRGEDNGFLHRFFARVFHGERGDR